MDLDPVICTKRNIHNRTEAEIEEIIAEWEPTPSHHPTIDATGFLQQNQIKEVEMEIVSEKLTEEDPTRNESAEVRVRRKHINYFCLIIRRYYFRNICLSKICANLSFHSTNLMLHLFNIVIHC